MKTQLNNRLTAANINTEHISAEDSAVLASMNTDELHAFAKAQQTNKDHSQSRSRSFFVMFAVF